MPGLGLGRSLVAQRRSGATLLGGAHTFNGTSTRIALTNAMTLQDFTIMGWVKADYVAFSTIIDFRDANNDGIRITSNASNAWRLYYNLGSAESFTLTNNTWVHVAVSRNSGTGILNLIVNGGDAVNTTIGTTNATTTAGMIGRQSFTASQFYKGQLAQMAVFNTGLSAATISGLMNKTYSQLSAGDKTNLVSWWALTNISGTSVPDLHGTNHGTLTP